MLLFLRDKANGRKLQLFAVAMRRQTAGYADVPDLQEAVSVVERHADGLLEIDEYARYKTVFHHRLITGVGARISSSGESAWREAYRFFLNGSLDEPLAAAMDLIAAANGTQDKVLWDQAAILRDLFGPTAFHPRPAPPEAIAPLAEEIYAGRWELMPLLGEWLQEHGFWTEGEHCLDPRVQHVKGCWVVDWVTGRE
jgi:hypothetical protein